VLNVLFVTGLALGLLLIIVWGVRTLPAERWQMLAAIPLAKAPDGSWRGLNLTFYGLFSALGTSFGFVVMLFLLASVGMPVLVSFLLFVFVLLVCIPASRIVAGLVERKKNTFTVAGAAFAATIILPWVLLAARPLAERFLDREIPIVPTFAALAIAYALGESIGRLACLSFGCCYGVPLRDANPTVAKLFQRHNLVISGSTKKAAYASGLADEPLIPVQAITSTLFAMSGIVGVALFLAQRFRLAALIPVLVSWGWRACSEWLRADYRGTSRISMYQLMAVFSAAYFGAFLAFVPAASPVTPDLTAGFSQLLSVPVVLLVQSLWLALFLYYGRSRVTASTLSFHVVADRI
jgi:Prolipoprotein diacylglyceryl transferase